MLQEALIEDIRNTPPSQAEPLPKKSASAQVIKDLSQKQRQPAPEEHSLTETTGYLKCEKCGINIHKRVNEAAFQQFIASQCVDQALTQANGRPSHPQPMANTRTSQMRPVWNSMAS